VTLKRSLIAGLMWFCACQGASAQSISLRYAQAYSALQSIFALPLLVAEREGYFAREGLDFSMLPVPGGGERLIAAGVATWQMSAMPSCKGRANG
jgi:ABC-type nitrate/sulfonate/bicarbonate transport system substrate-binding protein